MPVKPVFNPDFFYFVTTTAVGRAQIFQRDVVKRIIVDSFHHLRTAGQMKLFVFVIMPNHVHFISRFSEEFPLSDVLRDFKKFTARQIHRQFQAEGNEEMSNLMMVRGEGVRQVFKVWEDGYDARDVFSVKFLLQKMDYVHHNPCQPQWKLAQSPEDYVWSTAPYYLADKPCIIPIDDVREYL